jgi:hypothetical protein
MPTFSIPVGDGGIGFDYRMHMAVADKWIELLKYDLNISLVTFFGLKTKISDCAGKKMKIGSWVI